MSLHFAVEHVEEFHLPKICVGNLKQEWISIMKKSFLVWQAKTNPYARFRGPKARFCFLDWLPFERILPRENAIDGQQCRFIFKIFLIDIYVGPGICSN